MHKSTPSSDQAENLMKALIENHNTTSKNNLLSIIQSDDCELQVELARRLHTLLTTEDRHDVEAALLREASPQVREAMAGNSRLSKSSLRTLSKDRSDQIAMRAYASLQLQQARTSNKEAEESKQTPSHAERVILNRHAGDCLSLRQLYPIAYHDLEMRYGDKKGGVDDASFFVLEQMLASYHDDAATHRSNPVDGQPLSLSEGHNTNILSLIRSLCEDQSPPTLIVSSKLSGAELLIGVLATASNVAIHSMKNGLLTAQDWKQLADQVTMVCNANIHIVFDPMVTIADIISLCHLMQHQCGGIDHLMVPAAIAGENSRQVEQQLKQIGERFNAAVIPLDDL